METRSIARPVLMVLCLAATALGLNNTYGDDAPLRALAESTACGSAQCSVSLLREDRSAFKHSFSYQTRLLEQGKPHDQASASADVECRRAYYLVGAYQCALTSGGLPQAAR